MGWRGLVERLVEPRLIVFAHTLIDGRGEFIAGVPACGDLLPDVCLDALGPGFCLPQFRANERLATVKEALLYLDPGGQYTVSKGRSGLAVRIGAGLDGLHAGRAPKPGEPVLDLNPVRAIVEEDMDLRR